MLWYNDSRGERTLKKIFVSSTFRDMNEERDLFHTRICPELNEVAREYGESVAFCDLRWGVDTTALESEEGSRKVLSVCLDEIDRCRPYMVVLLGERYGWIPSADLLSETVRSRQEFELEELEKSVTALEIEYGALRNSDQMDRTLFYFRTLDGSPSEDYTSESELHAEKLRKLKQRIERLGYHVKQYTVRWDEEHQCVCDLDAFAETVLSDLRDLLEGEWQTLSQLTPIQKELHSHWEIATQKGGQFAARYDLVSHYLDLLQTESCFAIRGVSGSGKSTLMSRLALDLKEQGSTVLPIFCGNSALCSTAANVRESLIDFLESELEIKTEQTDRQEYLDELVKRYAETDRSTLIILIDAVDQLLPDEDRDALKFLPSCLSERVKVVFSCTDDFKILRALKIEEIPSLGREDRTAIVKGILHPSGRDLGEDVIQAIADKEGGEKPLYLSLLVSRLEMMDRDDFMDINRSGGGIDAINRKQIEIIRSCSTELDALCVELLETAAEKLGSKLPFVAANHIAMSRYGLRESDLESIFRLLDYGWDALSFSRFRQYLSRFFIQRDDGRLDFAHKSFRTGFLSATDDPKRLHETIYRHFCSLPEKDDVRLREVVYHCMGAGQKQDYVDYLTRYDEDKTAMTFAKENTTAYALQDGGVWICKLLQDRTLTGVTHHLYTFLIMEVLGELSDSKRALELMQCVFPAVIENKEQLLKTSRGHMLLDLSYFLLSKAYIGIGGMENFERAEELIQRVMEDMDTKWEAVDDENDELERKNKGLILVVSCHLAKLYVSIGQPQKVERALELLLVALDRAEKLRGDYNDTDLEDYIASICYVISSVYHRLDSEKYASEILAYCERSCEILERMEVADKSELVERYERIISVLSADPTPENTARSFDLAKKAVSIAEQALSAKESVDALARYAGALETLAGVHRKQEDTENLKQALDLMQRAITVQENVVREDDTESSISSLATYLFIVGDIYHDFGGEANLKLAYSYFERSIKLVEECVVRQDTPIMLQTLSSGYVRAGDTLEALGGDEDISCALAYYRRAIALDERVAEVLESEISYLLLRRSLGRFANLTEAQIGAEEALPWFVKRAEVDRAALGAFTSENWARNLADDLTTVCRYSSRVEGVWLEAEFQGYLERISLYEEWSAQGVSLYDADDLRIIYNNLAWLYENFEDKIDPAQAADCRMKSYEYAKTYHNEMQRDDTFRVVALCCRKLVKTYRGFDGADQAQLLAFAGESVALWEHVVEKDPDPKNRLQFALSYADLGEVTHDGSMLSHALELLHDLQSEIGDESYQKHITKIEQLLH